MIKALVLAGLLASGCTLIGASAGATTAEGTGNGGDLWRDVKIGALIGMGLDAAVIAYFAIAGSQMPE